LGRKGQHRVTGPVVGAAAYNFDADVLNLLQNGEPAVMAALYREVLDRSYRVAVSLWIGDIWTRDEFARTVAVHVLGDLWRRGRLASFLTLADLSRTAERLVHNTAVVLSRSGVWDSETTAEPDPDDFVEVEADLGGVPVSRMAAEPAAISEESGAYVVELEADEREADETAEERLIRTIFGRH
jgi:hypothetical protein